MAAGFEVKGNEYNTQVTSDSFSFMLQDSFLVSGTNPVNVSGSVLALEPDTGGQLTAPIKTQNQPTDSYTVKGSGRVYTFGDNVAGSNFGIEVYRADGSIAYNSSKKLLKVIDSGYLSAGGGEFRRSYGKPVAVIFNSVAVRAIPTQQSGGAWGARLAISSVAKSTDGTLIIGEAPDFARILIPRPETITISDKAHFLVIDASGLQKSN